MRVHLVHVLGAAAMLVACAGSSKETRTASNQPAGTTQQGSVEGTGTAAGSQGTVTAQGQSSTSSTQGSVSGSTTGTSGTATADSQGTSGSSTMGNDRSGQTNTSGQTTTGTGSTYGTSGTTSPSSSSTYGQSSTTSPSSGSTYGQSGTAGSSGSTYGQSGTGTPTSDTGTSASRSGSLDTSASPANLKWANGRVSKVDSDGKSITLDRASAAGGSITLTVDDQTQIVDRSGSTTSDLSSIKEGTQVRASFDPASNRAQRIEVMGKSGKKGMHKKSGDASSGSMKTNAPSANTAKNPPQDRTGAPQTNNPDQK